MTGQDFISSMLALRAWRDGHEDGLNAMLGIAHVYRNRVRAGWHSGDWIKVLEYHFEASPTDGDAEDAVTIPDPREHAFHSLLAEIPKIISGQAKDEFTTATNLAFGGGSVLSIAPARALYYGRLEAITSPWFLEHIARNPDHKRIASIGTVFFWT